MACFHPNPAVRTPRGMKLLPRANLAARENASHWLACGQCLGCRDSQTATWTIRLKHEARAHSSSIFLTFTYDDEHLPNGLQKRDIQLFWKRLRRQTNTQLKYFCCGEYGDKTKRPHYHAALFGHAIPTDAKRYDQTNLVSDTINDTWGQGRVTISELTTYRMAYVAGYVLKKAGYKRQIYCDENAEEIQGPFRLMSKALGKTWLTKYANDLRLGYVQHDQRKLPIPRYYTDRLKHEKGIIGPLTVEQIKNHGLHDRIQLARDTERLKRDAPDPERNKAAEKIREQQIKKARSKRQL